MVRALKLLVVLAALGIAGYFWPPSRMVALKLMGRAHGCPLMQAAGSLDYLNRMADANAAVKRNSRLIEKRLDYHLWQTPGGRFWVPAGSDNALHWDLAEQQVQIYGSDARGVRAGDVVLDCGANIGLYTHVALAAGARLVVAIEPAPENLECLRRNFAPQIQAGRVIVYPKGVWDREDALVLNEVPGNSAADSFVISRPQSRKGPVLALTTIDKLVAELKLDRVDFIKMDIEGAEGKALVGGRATLARFHPRMALAAYHRTDDSDALPAAARRAWRGYRVECSGCTYAGSYVQPVSILFY